MHTPSAELSEPTADVQGPRRQVHVAATQSDELPPAQPGECGRQNENAEPIRHSVRDREDLPDSRGRTLEQSGAPRLP
ncbi:hypothetical protein GCM10009608_79250 [Pseudonocardia alaniniphila]